MFLKKLIQKFWDKYPNKPLVYVCTHNGVTGAVCADDFDTEIRRMRKNFKKNGWENAVWPIRPQVYPIFLFSDKNVSERSFRVGSLKQLSELLKDCAVEFRDFELPPLNAPGSTPYGYYGQFEQVGRENTRHRVWTLEQAETCLKGGQIFTYNV